ncbi:MAG: class I SAM-dependent methyltransferase [Chthonomonadaceae bacterium]|nr:class I SAM-dependent methyltransferase [Chthonomonadaceae bacterium]
MLDVCGSLEGRRVLDVGCGEGRFARMLRERGAWVLGVDPIPRLVQEASARDRAGFYLRGSGEQLPVCDGAFDLVVSYLTLIDIPDFRAAIAEMARALRKGGRLVVANINAFCTADPRGWLHDEAGNKLHFPVDRYLEERPNRVAWKGISVENWHRPMSATMGAFLTCGLTLKQYLEPAPPDDLRAAHPEWDHFWRVPYFHVLEWEKAP